MSAFQQQIRGLELHKRDIGNQVSQTQNMWTPRSATGAGLQTYTPTGYPKTKAQEVIVSPCLEKVEEKKEETETTVQSTTEENTSKTSPTRM